MKQLILFTIILLLAKPGTTQTFVSHSSAVHEAAAWKTWSVENPGKITIAAPPSAAQSQAEVAVVKRRRSAVNAQAMTAIQYWDAGAPSYRWNQIGPKLISYDKFNEVARTPTAWMNLAIYDATVLAWKEKLKYKRKRPASLDQTLTTLVTPPPTYSYPCEHTVTAAAAAHVLAYFFPGKADSILQLARTASQSRIDAGVQFPSDVDAGWNLGEQVAKQVIEKAKNDGSSRVWSGTINKDPKKWTGGFALGINLPLYETLVLQSADQFRPLAPPDFDKEMKELKDFKQTFKTRSLAYYWANSGGFEFWSEVAGQKMFEYRIMDNAPVAARIYTVLHAAYHDVMIAVMDAKYAYWGIRPSQYDSSYQPLLGTPPFPGYPSGHAAGAGTTSAVMEYFFPADTKYFRQLAQDCADSRFFAGIHFRTDNEVGLQMGRQLGRYIAETLLKK